MPRITWEDNCPNKLQVVIVLYLSRTVKVIWDQIFFVNHVMIVIEKVRSFCGWEGECRKMRAELLGYSGVNGEKKRTYLV